MRQLIFICFVICLLCSCGVQHQLSGNVPGEDTSYVYRLPYQKGRAYLLVQGYNSWFSHKGRLGLDFKMKKGTPVHAARGGVVISAEESFTKGGVNKKYLRKANGVILRHTDGTFAIYGHLQHNGAAVAVGDTITLGQLIGYSGSVGYSAFPHLHFAVWKSGINGNRRTLIPTRFYTKKGIHYLRPGRWYRSV